MVRVVDCHAGILGSNPGGSKRFSPWNHLTSGSGYSVAPELASGNGSGLSIGTDEAQLSKNKKGMSVLTMPFLTASLLG